MTTPDLLAADSSLDWRDELVAAAWIATFVTVAGGAVGLVWAGVAPKLSIARLAAASDATFRAQAGADAWFLIVAAVAGALSAVVVCGVFGRRGPGAALGLGVGGVLGSLVADRVGYLSEHGSTSAALQALGLHPAGNVVAEIDFRVRALGVLTVWSLMAMLALGVAVAIEASRR